MAKVVTLPSVCQGTAPVASAETVKALFQYEGYPPSCHNVGVELSMYSTIKLQLYNHGRKLPVQKLPGGQDGLMDGI